MSLFKRDCVSQPSVGASRLVGDPVDVITGAVIDQDTELRLPGARTPLDWVRYYDSRHAAADRGIGRGFRHELDHELRLDVDGLTYSDPRGNEVGFPFLTIDGERVRVQHIVLERLSDKSYRLELPTGRWLEFSFRTGALVGRLDIIQQREHYLTLRYEGRSHELQSVGLGDLGSLRVDWSDGRIARLVLVKPDTEDEQILARYHYDDRGCLIEAQNPFKHALKYTYDSEQRLLTKTDRRDYAYHYVYDAEGRCIESRGADGAQAVQLEYRPIERTTIVTRHDGGKWVYQYTDSGTITNVLDPCGGMQSFVIDDAGRVAEEIDPLGNQTRIVHDEHGRPRAKRDPWGYTLPLDPDEPAPHPLEHRTASHALGYMYGALYPVPERRPATGDPLWSVPWQARRVVADADPEWGGHVQRELSLFGTPLCDRREDGRTRRWAYNENTRLRWVQDFDGGKRSFEYESDSYLARETNAVGAITRFEHSPTGELTALTDAGGTRSEYVLDAADRVVEVRRHGGTRERYVYDLGGNLIQKRDAHGVLLLELTIGRGNLKTGRQLGSGELQTFDYDERGRLVEARGDAGNCTFAYGSGGARTRDLRDELGVEHEGDGSRTTVLERFVVQYATLRTGERVITDPTGRSHRVRELGRGIFEHKWSNGACEISQFDVDGRCLSKTLLRFEGDDRPWQRVFRFSGEGDLLERRDNERGDSQYRYDAAHRLVHVGHARGRTESYEHDLAGNLLRMPSPIPESRALDHGQRMLLQEGNRLLGAERFHYDHRDHIARRETPYGSTEYVRDALDQLVRVRGPELDVAAQYDPLGRRTHKTVNGREHTYYWDGDRLAAEVFPAGGVRVYVYAAPLAMVPLMFVDYASLDAPPESGARFYVLSDHRGAVELVLDGKAEAVWSARIDPYGLALVETGARFYMPLRFPGHFYDAESGLHYNRFRYYDPALGRYLESDPLGIEGGRNLYAYTRNPLREVDLRGLSGGPECTDCQKKADGTEATEGQKEKESNQDPEPPVLEQNAKPPKTRADDPPWPPRTIEAHNATRDVAKAVSDVNAAQRKQNGMNLIGKDSAAVVAVRTHKDGSRSVGISNISNDKAKRVEDQLNSSPEAVAFSKRKKEEDGEDKKMWQVRGDVDPELANKPKLGSNVEPSNCAEPRCASAARANTSPQTGHDVAERSGSQRAIDSEAGKPNPHALKEDDPRLLDGTKGQLCPCSNCQNHADSYNEHAAKGKS